MLMKRDFLLYYTHDPQEFVWSFRGKNAGVTKLAQCRVIYKIMIRVLHDRSRY